MKSWSIKLENVDIKNLIPPDITLSNELQSIDRKEKITNSNISYKGNLSSIEQLLLAKYYVFRDIDFYDFLINLDKLTDTKKELYASNFEKVTYYYSGNSMKIVKLERPIKKSLEKFNEQHKIANINLFVNGLYLQPNKEYSNLQYSELYKDKSRTAFYQLNKTSIEMLTENEISKENELIDFLRLCYFDGFKIEPNMLMFNSNLLENYAIRFLATIYENVYFVVKEETKRIMLIGAN